MTEKVKPCAYVVRDEPQYGYGDDYDGAYTCMNKNCPYYGGEWGATCCEYTYDEYGEPIKHLGICKYRYVPDCKYYRKLGANFEYSDELGCKNSKNKNGYNCYCDDCLEHPCKYRVSAKCDPKETEND